MLYDTPQERKLPLHVCIHKIIVWCIFSNTLSKIIVWCIFSMFQLCPNGLKLFFASIQTQSKAPYKILDFSDHFFVITTFFGAINRRKNVELPLQHRFLHLPPSKLFHWPYELDPVEKFSIIPDHFRDTLSSTSNWRVPSRGNIIHL